MCARRYTVDVPSVTRRMSSVKELNLLEERSDSCVYDRVRDYVKG